MNGVKISGNGCDGTIAASELKNGQVAVIVKSIYSSAHTGRIVCRHKFNTTDHLTVVGYDTYFANASLLTGDKCRVRVLKAGEQLTIC